MEATRHEVRDTLPTESVIVEISTYIVGPMVNSCDIEEMLVDWRSVYF
jgi:hypothetical protein